MQFPVISEAQRLERLEPPQGKIRMVLDTDTYNEIDDQFAVVYSLLSPERLSVEAIHAAPFFNERSSGPSEGMKKSYDEILRLLERLGRQHQDFVFRGSEEFMSSLDHPQKSEAALNLIKLAMSENTAPLYVVGIGALTNIASAILIEPEIIRRIVVVWLGGEPHHWNNAVEFNLSQDPIAARVLFDCGVPLVQIPCYGMASHLLTTVPELERYIQGKSPVGDYLVQIFRDYCSGDDSAWAKEIWDISAIAWLINSEWIPSQIVHSPILTDLVTWSFDRSRHFIRVATFVHRNPIFADFFSKL